MFDSLFQKNKKEFTPEKEEKKTWRLWRKSLVKSQEIVTAQSRNAAKELEWVYEDRLRQATDRMEKEFSQVVSVAQQDFGKFLARLEKESSDAQEKKMKEFDKVVDDALSSFTSELLNKLAKAEEKARQEVEAYKTSAITLISQKAQIILEKATRIVLGKSLSTQDQTDLIIEAIDQAKKEEFLS